MLKKIASYFLYKLFKNREILFDVIFQCYRTYTGEEDDYRAMTFLLEDLSGLLSKLKIDKETIKQRINHELDKIKR